MRARMLTMLGLAVLLALPAGVVAARPAGCQQVSGTFLGQAVPTATGFDVFVVEATGELGGQPAGTHLVVVTVQHVTPGGTVHFTGVHTFETATLGTLVTSDKGSIAPNGRAHNTLTIVEGGSGSISVHGTADLATGLIDATYRGRVCPA